jgi:integrase
MKGTIFRRSPGSWSVVVPMGYGPDGKYHRSWQTVRGPKKDAERLLATLVHQVNTGTYIEPCELSLHEHLREWLAYVSKRLSARTVQRYAEIIEGHLIPALGTKRLVDLRPLDISRYYDYALAHGRLAGDAPLSRSTLLKFHHVLHKALKEAVAWQRIATNPAAAVTVPNGADRPAAKARSLTDEECARLLRAVAGDRLEVPVLFTLATGLRRGELLGLRWCDLDLEAAKLRVAHSLEEAGGVLRLKEPKTRAGRRTIPLPATAVQVLRHHRAAQDELRLASGPAYDDHDHVFCLPDGSPWRPSAFSVAFHRLVKRTAIEAARFHDLRHTHATQLLRAGVAPKVVSERLGHANIAITLDIYAHVLPEMQNEAAARMDVILQRALGAEQ